jgi:hypothetical protein
MGDHRHYSWEPVILRGGRRPSGYAKSHLVLSPPQFTFRPRPAEHVIGEKPEGFCHWLFDCAGLRRDDELVDLFPGSDAVTRAWSTWIPGSSTASPKPKQPAQLSLDLCECGVELDGRTVALLAPDGSASLVLPRMCKVHLDAELERLPAVYVDGRPALRVDG